MLKKSFQVCDLMWPDVEAAVRDDPIAILPIAAQAKEHGLHLPMNTDHQQARWITNQLLLEPGYLIWPCVNYGYYPAFIEFPGSVTTTESTFVNLINEIIESVFTAGVSKLVLLNTGISTIKPLSHVLDQSKHDLSLLNVYSGKNFNQTVSHIIEQSAGGHADEIETSIMLAINQAQVAISLASGSTHACSEPGVLRRFEKHSPNYTPSGACGSPEKASAEKGVELLNSMMTDILDTLKVLKQR